MAARPTKRTTIDEAQDSCAFLDTQLNQSVERAYGFLPHQILINIGLKLVCHNLASARTTEGRKDTHFARAILRSRLLLGRLEHHFAEDLPLLLL